MGGKTSSTTSQVQIPPEVLARYSSVNATAQQAAGTPFQQYSTDPNAFVAPLTATQQAGIANTNAAAGMAQPYFNAATGFALAGSGAVNPGQLDAQKYMNPYLQTVLGSTEAMVNQQNQQAQAGQTGSAINQGYFGGDRSGIAQAVLSGQQELAGGQLYSGIASDAYSQAMQAAMQQQGVGLGAEQANRAALQGTAGTLAQLGQGAQGAALEGAQAQLGAGQVQQQTQQAGQSALYNQFLQQQSYPFQIAQFLANIAEGTGALSGSTTTQTQPGGLFMSDERLKEAMEPIGKGFDGANIYRYRYKDDPHNVTRIGFSAQEMARHHPEAVHDVGGFGAIEQHAATEESARRGGFALAANDNGYATGGRIAREAGGLSEWGSYPQGANPMVIAQLLAAQEQMYGPYAQGGLYGGSASGAPHGGATGYVPQASLPIGQLQVSQPTKQDQSSALHEAAQAAGDITTLSDDATKVYDWGKGVKERHDLGPKADLSGIKPIDQASGGFVRAHRDMGGGFDPSDPHNDNPYLPKGAGLNIPTADTQQRPQLAVAKPPGQGESGLDKAGSTASDIASMAKLAMMFAGAKRGGRVGYDDGGGVTVPIPWDTRGSLDPDDAPTSPDTAVTVPIPASVRDKLHPGAGTLHDLANLPPTDPTSAAMRAGAYAAQTGANMGPKEQRILATSLVGGPTRGPLGPSSVWDTAMAASADADHVAAATPPPGLAATGAWAGADLGAKLGAATAHPAAGAAPPTPAAAPGAAPTPAPAHHHARHPLRMDVGMRAVPGSSQPPAPDDITSLINDTSQREPGFGSASVTGGAGDLTPQAVRHEGGPPLPTLDAQGGPGTPGGVTHDTGFGPAARSGLPGAPGAAPAAQDHPGGLGGFLGGIEHALSGFGKAAMGLAGYEGDGKWDRDKLIPFINTIAGTLAAPTKYPMVALTQGLKQGAESYMGQQQREAQIGNEQQVALANRWGMLPDALKQGTAPALGPDPNGDHTKEFSVGNKLYHVERASDLIPRRAGATPPTAGGAAAAAAPGVPPAGGAARPPAAAITADYSGGTPRYAIGPSQAEIDRVQQRYGIDQGDDALGNRMAVGMAGGPTDQQNQLATDQAQLLEGNPLQVTQDQANLRDSVQQLESLPNTGPGAVGAGQQERQMALQMYNLVGRMFLGDQWKGDPTIEAATDATQILEKLNTLQGNAMNNQYGLKAAKTAEQLQGVLPSGHIQKGAAYNIIAQMMVGNQMSRDFAQYRQQYQRLGLNDAGSVQAFLRDFGPQYNKERAELPRILARNPNTPNSPSIFEVLMKDPSRIKDFEQGFDDAKGHHQGFGTGFGRLFAG